jgi:hypothetical protein
MPVANCAGVVDTGGNLPPTSMTTVANLSSVWLTPVATLPPVSLTLAKLVEKFAASVVELVVHLDLQISPRLFEKFKTS